MKERKITESEIENPPRAITPPIVGRSSRTKTALICSEGLTQTEYQSDLWFDGLTFSDDTCYGYPPQETVDHNLD